MGKCTLHVGGMIYGGWKEIEIQRGLEQVSGRFTLTLVARLPGQPESWVLRAGQSCQVQLDGIPVVTGFLDVVSPGKDDRNAWLTVEGRDKTADLVDCSAIYKTGQWKNASLATIAANLIAPFGIELVIGDRAKTAANKKIPSFNIEEGETVFACIERAARLQAVMLWTDGLGRLVIDLPGETRAEVGLIEGRNLKYLQGRFSWAERYSQYTIKGHAKYGDDEDPDSSSNTKLRHQIKGVAADSVITRYRPLVVLAEDHGKNATAKERAQWEATVRAGRGNRATVKVCGWRQAEGKPLWVPGLRATVDSATLRVSCDLLVANVTYRLNDRDGELTEMEIADPRAFDKISGVRGTSLRSKAKGKNGMAVSTRADKQKKTSDKNDWGGM